MAMPNTQPNTQHPTPRLPGEASEAERYYAVISQYPLLSAEEERELARRMHAGGPDALAAKERLLQCNLRWVWAVAAWYANAQASIVDLAQVGAASVWQHMGKFDPFAAKTRGVRFTTFMTWYLRRDINRAAMEIGNPIRRPVYVWTRERRLYRALEAHLAETGEAPSTETLSDVLDLPATETQAIQARAAVRPRMLSLDNAQRLPGGSRTRRSGEEEARSDAVDAVLAAAGVMAPSTEDECLEEVAAGEITQQVTALVAEVLQGRELQVIALRFGDGMTAAAVGRHLGISRERVRQIEARAIRRLREHPRARRALRALYEDAN